MSAGHAAKHKRAITPASNSEPAHNVGFAKGEAPREVFFAGAFYFFNYFASRATDVRRRVSNRAYGRRARFAPAFALL